MNGPDPAWMTQAIAVDFLKYEPETGIFFWRVFRSGAIKPGVEAGQIIRSGYRSITVNRRGFLEHRLAWLMVHGKWPNGEVDHINRNRLDNRIVNLRVVTRSQNMHNTKRRKTPASGEEGLSRKDGLWYARISFKGKEIYLGSHEDKDVARLMRGLAKDRALKGMRPLAAKERKVIDLDSEDWRE